MQNVSNATRHITSHQVTSSKVNVHYHFSFQGRGAVAQSVERPKGPSLVQLSQGSKHATALELEIFVSKSLATPSIWRTQN